MGQATKRKVFNLPPELLARLERYRQQCSPIPSEAEAVRQLLDQALKAREAAEQPAATRKRASAR